MNDNELEQMLLSYTLPDIQAEQIEIVCQKALSMIKRRAPTRPFSIFEQMKVQAAYLSKSFYIACCLISLLSLAVSAATEPEKIAAVFFGISPLFVIPCASVFYFAVSNGMLEVETASKYSMAKLFTGKLLILGAIVTTMLLAAGSIGGSMSSSVARPPLLAFSSFTCTAAIVLWFGKRSIKAGLGFGSAWGFLSIALSFSAKWQIFLDKASILYVCLAALAASGFALAASARLINNISFEGTREAWNFSLTA